MLALFDSSPLIQNSKFNNFLWVSWFFGKNISNFLSPIWKLHNPYCHTVFIPWNEKIWMRFQKTFWLHCYKSHKLQWIWKTCSARVQRTQNKVIRKKTRLCILRTDLFLQFSMLFNTDSIIQSSFFKRCKEMFWFNNGMEQ